MFHHFHNNIHPKGQGSLGQSDFARMLNWLSAHYNLLSAEDYHQKALEGNLADNDICLSFDDALLCQYDVAVPVMCDFGIRAFFFVYSSPMCGEADLLEVFRYFRTVEYDGIDHFYDEFFTLCEQEYPMRYRWEKARYDNQDYLKDFQFYSDNDRWFRYLRDKVFGKADYEALMLELMQLKGFFIDTIADKLWLNDKQLCALSEEGHILGLHSYSHPTTLHELGRVDQLAEFSKNFAHLSSLIGAEAITSMSHPCGNYNADTLGVLSQLGIRLGFRSNMAVQKIESLLEIPREDHANVAKEMGLCV